MGKTISRIRDALLDGLFDAIPDALTSRLARKFASPAGADVKMGSEWEAAMDFLTRPFEDAYQVHSWVFACVRAVSANIAQVELGLYRRQAKGRGPRGDRIFDHPLARLIENPNPYISGYTLKFLTVAYQELTGDAFWYLARPKGGGPAGQIIPMRPDRVRIVPDAVKYVRAYEYTCAGAEPVPLPPEDVIHFRYFNPVHDYRGQATLKAAKPAMENDVYAIRYNTAFYQNSGMPKGALKFDQVLDQDRDYPRIRAEWAKVHGGGPDKAHKIAIFEKGGSWLNIGLSQKDMDFVLQRKFNRNEIAGVFGVPPVMVAAYEEVNYNTARVQKAMFWHDTAIPKLMEMRDHLNLMRWKLLGRGAAGLASDVYFDFELASIWALQQEERDRLTADLKGIEKGLFTINEIRHKRNQDPVPWGSVYWRPIGLVPTEKPEDAVGDSAGVGAASGGIRKRSGGGNGGDGPAIVLRSDRGRAARLAEWKGFAAHADEWEPRFEAVMKAILKDQRDQVLAAIRSRRWALSAKSAIALPLDRKITEAEIETVLFDAEEAQAMTAEATDPLYRRMTRAGGNRGIELAGVAASFDLEDPFVAGVIAETEQRFAERVTETTWRALKAGMIESVDLGETMAEMADRVEEIMAGRIRSSKYTIARTEVVGALNGGVWTGFRQTGVVIGKEWAASGDGHERDSHAKADGQIVPLEGHFELYYPPPILYPGDPNAHVRERANCRCTSLPVLA